MDHESTPPATPSEPPSGGGGPDHRDLYLIVVGVLLGVLLGPGVLGRFAPAVYDRIFVGRESVRLITDEMQRLQAETLTTAERIQASGASEEALVEALAPGREKAAALQERLIAVVEAERASRRGRVTAIILTLVAIMVIETLVQPTGATLRGRLATARYALIALWLAFLLAQPHLLREIPIAFLIGLIAVALVAALTPLARRASPAT